MSLVVDASALVDALGLPTRRAEWLLAAMLQHEVLYTAPHADLECMDAWRNLAQRGLLRRSDLGRFVGQLSITPLERIPTHPFNARIAELLQNCSPFDAAYVALAEALSAPLLTCDLRLARAPGTSCEFLTPPLRVS